MKALKKYSRVEFKRIRTAYKISHKEIACVIGKTPKYVCDYENGRRGSSAVEFLLTYILNTIVEEKKEAESEVKE